MIISRPDETLEITEGMKKAVEFLRRPEALSLADGNYNLEGKSLCARVQTYITRENDRGEYRFEAHRRHIDIQYIVSGSEDIVTGPAEEMAVTEDYDEDADVCFGTLPEKLQKKVTLSQGDFMVLYPWEAHAPMQAPGAPGKVKKIVVKVLTGERR